MAIIGTVFSPAVTVPRVLKTGPGCSITYGDGTRENATAPDQREAQQHGSDSPLAGAGCPALQAVVGEENHRRPFEKLFATGALSQGASLGQKALRRPHKRLA